MPAFPKDPSPPGEPRVAFAGRLAVAWACAGLLIVSAGAAERAALTERRQEPTPLPEAPTSGSAQEELQAAPGSEPAVLACLDRGLAFLALQQRKGTTGALPCTSGEHHAPVGVTALAALAWIGGGSSLTRGPYKDELGRALDYLLDGQIQDGERKGYFTATGDQVSQTHGHGLATLALAQAYTISPRSPRGKRLEEALTMACDRILAAQGVDGGWYYSATPSVQQEGSVTVALVWALRGAKDAGIHIPVEPIDRAIAYVKSLQDERGGFQYSATRPTTSVALTAAALSTLHATGTYSGPTIDAGYDYVWRELAGREVQSERGRPARIAFPFYERLYLAQALYQHKDLSHYQTWSAPLRQQLLRSQEKDGSWSDTRWDPSGAKIQSRYGPSYATAVNCLVLSIPHSTLPIFMR